MKLNLRIASLLLVIGIFGFSSNILAQTNKKTNTKAQPKSEAKSSETKKTTMTVSGKKAISVDKVNKELKTKPGGSSNNGNRPASTGTPLTDYDWIARVNHATGKVSSALGAFVRENGDNGGANGARALDFVGYAFSDINKLYGYYKEQNGIENWSANSSNYEQIPGNSLNSIKAQLEQALTFFDNFDYEYNGLRASAKDKIQQSIRQFQFYMDNLPAGVKKNNPGDEKVKGKSGKKFGNEQSPAKPATPTNKKPKASGKTTKPTDNLSVGDDPFGKTTKKPKTKGGNQ